MAAEQPAVPDMSEICTDCEGTGKATALVRFAMPVRCEEVTMACPRCDGVGAFSEAHLARIRVGEELRRDRVGRAVSLREEAKRIGITERELNDRERGRA